MTLAALLLLAAAGPADLDVMAQARAGKLLCANPDPRAKRCTSISAYAVAANGSVTETTEAALPGQPLTLTLTLPATVEGNRMCGVMTLADLKRGTIKRGGAPLSPADAAQVLDMLSANLGLLAGKRTCDTLRIAGGRLMKQGRVEGIDLRPPAKPMLWVSRSEGYRVTPR